MKIDSKKVIAKYRGTNWTQANPIRLYVTEDFRIWIGFGENPIRFSHVANVGDRGTASLSREAILRAANS